MQYPIKNWFLWLYLQTVLNKAVLALISFAFVMSITPGPNNIMLSASGANYGLRRTIPHMLGVSIGFASLIFFCGLGLGAVFEQFPLIQTILKVVGSLYLLYLAYRIAKASFSDDHEVRKPFTFWEAAAFQYANPKAWVMALTTMSTLSIPHPSFVISAALTTLIVIIVNLPSITVWVLFGQAIGKLLKHKRALIVFNLVMAALLVGTIVFILR